ncbi:MAG: LacI family DNA-binding transcriptional regulator [Planctomycetes bacterium]|nr:LacI family DNA-binding transcriptional regulator [Planctomycetota bacterium]
MAVTQRDIADHLGVSVATVSRALNNSSNLKPRTRSKVMDAAAKLGYDPPNAYRKPNGTARDTRNFGVLLRYDGPSAAPGHTRMLAGISQMCESRGKLLNVHYAPGDRLDKLTGENPPALLEPNRVGGLILLNYFPEDIVEWLACRWPVVVVHHYSPGLDVDIIEVDATDGIGRLVQRLQDLGHRKIGFIGDARRYEWTHARHAAFLQALSTLDMEYDPSLFTDARSNNPGEIGDWMETHMREGVSAWMCACDHLAQAVGEELLEREYSIPADVSLTGFDGTNSLPDGRPITSIETPFESIGATAAEALVRRLEYPQAARQHILVPGRVVEGATIGPVT